ncbi:MAG TPA: WD40 repeat domain-containing protein [Aggregatilineales bacterium]|nr:WD40 repeat domain-containing protein [Anaerolineales bacterium]HRE46979.1 WD40 repeat domain-containing protein [Aggregatilineales bacterium]
MRKLTLILSLVFMGIGGSTNPRPSMAQESPYRFVRQFWLEDIPFTKKVPSPVSADTTPAISLDWIPNGAQIAIAYVDGRAGVWDALSGQMMWMQRDSTTPPWVRWNPDGDSIVTTSKTDLVVWKAATGEILKRIPYAGYGCPQRGNDPLQDTPPP